MPHATTLRDLKAHFIGLANPTRLAIISLLVDGEMPAAEIARSLKLSQPLLSWHLRVMRRAGLLQTRRRGREVSCALDLASIRSLQLQFNQLINLAGSPVANLAERRPPQADTVSKETANAI